MFETYKLHTNLWRVTEHKANIILWKTENECWKVYDARTDAWVAQDLETFEEAESAAHQYISKTSR